MASMHAHTGHTQPPEGAGAMQVLGPLIVASSVVTMMLLISVSLTEIGALGKRMRHGVSLRRLRSAAQAEEEATAARAS